MSNTEYNREILPLNVKTPRTIFFTHDCQISINQGNPIVNVLRHNSFVCAQGASSPTRFTCCDWLILATITGVLILDSILHLDMFQRSNSIVT